MVRLFAKNALMPTLLPSDAFPEALSPMMLPVIETLLV